MEVLHEWLDGKKGSRSQQKKEGTIKKQKTEDGTKGREEIKERKLKEEKDRGRQELNIKT